jgi:hypothetical protein
MTAEKLQQKLALLSADSPSQFGIMTPQHMVEHLIITFKLSQGKISLPEKEPSPRALEAKQAILYGNMELPRGVKAPGLGDQLMELRFGSLDEAKVGLAKALEDFDLYYASNKDLKHYHPAFGKLNYEEWLAFHQKHFKHHLGQFGISW